MMFLKEPLTSGHVMGFNDGAVLCYGNRRGSFSKPSGEGRVSRGA